MNSGPASDDVASFVRYVALGDSYTIGTRVEPGERWPDQLVGRLQADGLDVRLVANLAVNGYTSEDLIAEQLPRLGELRPDLVTVLVGVNDIVQGVPEANYRANVRRILDELLVRLAATRIVTISTPDYTVTPQGAAYGDPTRQSARIRETNDILRAEATARGIRYVDIHDISLQAGQDRTLVAGDGLHPSALQYARWIDRIEPVVRELLGSPR